MSAVPARVGPAPAPIVKSNTAPAKPEADILFQTYFKSVGPRTYAAQVKRAGNGNHFLVLTEGKRDEKTEEVRKTRLYLFSEDFVAFFKMLQETSLFIRANPVPEEVKKKRERFWARKDTGPKTQVAPRPDALNARQKSGPGMAAQKPRIARQVAGAR
jgi:hypothetical protein